MRLYIYDITVLMPSLIIDASTNHWINWSPFTTHTIYKFACFPSYLTYIFLASIHLLSVLICQSICPYVCPFHFINYLWFILLLKFVFNKSIQEKFNFVPVFGIFFRSNLWTIYKIEYFCNSSNFLDDSRINYYTGFQNVPQSCFRFDDTIKLI